MTTTDAVAARNEDVAAAHIGLRARTGMRSLVAAGALGLMLAGCSSSGLLDGNSASDVQSVSAGSASPAGKSSSPVSQSRVSVAPVMGAPEALSKQVGDNLGSALQKQRVAVAPATEKADYTLRGYMVATRERAGTKVAYIFDLTDTTGKRLNRIQGEEMAQGGDARDPWSAVTPEISQRISDKAASSLSATLASLPASGGSTVAMAPPVGAGAATAEPPRSAAVPGPQAPTTGSINSAALPTGAPAAIVPAVTGAPGDGNTALSGAMRQELQQAGVGSASPGQKAYSVAGKVAVGGAKDGKQSVKIDWRVTDPNGALLATVSQNNEIQAGALDGSWGNIAADAAQGAAARIKQLIDEHQAGAGKVGAQSPGRSRG